MRLSSLGATALLMSLSLASAAVRINEVSDKGTSNACKGNDWVELYNSGPEDVDLSAGYILHDDKGATSENAFTFPPGYFLAANSYLLLCTKLQAGSGSQRDDQIGFTLDELSSPNFGIGGKDTITLVQKNSQDQDTAQSKNILLEVISSVSLPGTDNDVDVTYAFNETSGTYAYTSTPTPDEANVFTRVKTSEEKLAEHRAAMVAQNALGTQFFGMDVNGYKVDDAMDTVLALHVTMAPAEYDYLMANKTHEVYRAFTNASLTTTEGELITTIDHPGRIRTKGQSTLYFGVCLDTDTVPFQIDFSSEEDKSQSLFGVQKIYLRHHMGDFSYLRDYSYNRMLARFGLPYLRVRKVEFYINGEKKGYYSLMEAVDQEYVFARSFPDYDPDSFAVYKIKSMALDCGAYSEEDMEKAKSRLSETNTPPYAFQRGTHKPEVEVLGQFSIQQCTRSFVDDIWGVDLADTVLAYQRYDEDCVEMLLGEGLIDRDLGTKNWDKEMRKFIDNNFRGDRKCNEQCANSDFAQNADVDNLLKTFAFYAVLMIADSPLINGNNYYLAQSGDEANGGPGGWKIVAYDFNAARVVFCNSNTCNPRLVHWSITRPTCESLEGNPIAGPLLSDPVLFDKYLEYVREFTNSVVANETFIAELEEHQAAQKTFVRKDFWSALGIYYSAEMTTESSKWEEEEDRFPLLPTLKARVEDVRSQLAAIDSGMFPRGPHGIGVNGDYEPWEPCPDWRGQQVNATTCEQACEYEGCNMPEWTVPSYCTELTGTCYHGDYDEQCRGLKDGERYPDMEDTEDGRPTFCRFAAGVPVKAAECPAVGQAQPAPLESSAVFRSLLGVLIASALTAMLFVLV